MSKARIERPQLMLAGGMLVVLLSLSIWLLPGVFRLLVPLGVIASVVLMSAPIVGLSLAFLTRIWVDMFWNVGFGSTNVMQLFSGAVVFLAGVYAWMYLHRTLAHPLIAPLALYLVLMVISGSHDPSFAAATAIVARQLGPLLLLILFHILFLERQDMRERLIKWFIVFALVPVGYALYSQLQGINISHADQYPRQLGGYKNIHGAAHMMALFAMTAAFQLRVTKKRSGQLLLVLFLVAVIYVHQITFVRTTTVASVAYFGMLLVLMRRFDVLGLGVLFGAVYVAQSEFMMDRYGEIINFLVEGQSTETDRIGSGRVGIYRRGMNEFLSRPLFNLMFGVGMMESMNLGKYRHDIHSDYLYLLFSLGPGGLLIYLWIQVRTVLGAIWVRAHSVSEWSRRFAEHVICLNVAAVVVNLISNSYVTRLSPGWIFMGMCGLLLGIEADLRRELAIKASQSARKPSESLTPTGIWSDDFQSVPQPRRLEFLRGTRPGLGRYWKPLNGPSD